jgi:hypothetical protein
VPVPPQQYAEIVEPGDYALQLDAVHQKYRQRRLVLSYVIEKRILEILCPIGHFLLS